MKHLKKTASLCAALLLTFCIFIIPAIAQERFKVIVIEAENGSEVIINIPPELVDEISEDELAHLVSQNELQGGETITIHKVVHGEQISKNKPKQGLIALAYCYSMGLLLKILIIVG
jgi:hypothetical protein